MRFIATVVSIAVGTASGIAPEEHSFAFEEITVDDLGAVPSDECFYDVTSHSPWVDQICMGKLQDII